jgi:antitoxin component YwqK of YwqJK toxin-antitoxin module
MSKSKKVIITLIVISISFIALKLILKSYRNTDTILCRISNILNENNGFAIQTSGLDQNKLEIIWINEMNQKHIYSNGKQIAKIDHEYGKNGFEIQVNPSTKFNVGHIKTKNWTSHNYTIKINKDSTEYKIEFIANGPFYEHTIHRYNLKSKLHGTSCSYYKNGKLSTSGTYINGKMDGEYKFYNENGKIRAITYYKNGEELH